MKRYLVILVVLLALSLLLPACAATTTTTAPAPAAPATSAPAVSSQPASTQTTSAPATTSQATSVPATTRPATTAPPTTASNPKYGGVFKFVDPRAPSTTLGWFAEAGAQGGMWSPPMLESFMECDIKGNFSPMLATKWDLAPDLKSITLTLRQGVKFHDGSDFNAAVAKWNLEEMINAKVGVNYTNISSIDILDDYTIRLNLARYQNSMFNTLAATYMISKFAFDTKGKEWMRWNPIGTGPFKFVSFTRDVVIKYVKNQNYWQKGKPYLDGIEMYFVSDPVTMSAAFEAGDFHAMGGDLSSVHYDLQQKGNPIVSCYAGAYVLVPDSKNADSPWNNLKVRLALDYAIDRDSLVKARGFGFWQTVYHFANPGTPAFITNLENRTYNLDKAKQLMTEAGYPNGFQTKIYADVASSDKDAITAVQAYMARIGIKAELNILDFASYGNYRSRGWNNAVLAGMSGFDANLNNSIERSWTKSAAQFPSVDKSDELQSLHLASLAAPAFEPALIQKVLRNLYDNALFLPLWAGSRGHVLKPFVKDTGFYTLQSWPGWKPYNTWLDR
ncbi:MAG TPA: ABC transporter substrate-binding protein [Dehalococcoidales bacterium]|nr:ABC transporter substrate-binding protein [Dehalococcoidales bacterium]